MTADDATSRDHAISTRGSHGLLTPRMRRLVRSYGVLVLIAIGFMLMALLVRERPRTVPVESLSRPTAQGVALWL